MPSTNGRRLLNAFTVDVEDYFQVSGFEKGIQRDQWDHWNSRVVKNTHCILELLDRHDVKATFFILGWVARRYPQLVREISRCGHEIASHSYWHRLIYEQSPEEFRKDLQQTRDALMDAIGERITAHDLAGWAESCVHEVTTVIGKRVARTYIESSNPSTAKEE